MRRDDDGAGTVAVMRLLHGVLIVACAGLAGCGSGCSDPSPSSETCEATALTGTPTDVTLGRMDGETFVAYADGDVASLVYGGQGFPMLVFRLQVRGAGLGDCIPQATTVYRGESVVGSETLPLVADQVLPDLWLTGEALVIVFDASEGDLVTAEAVVGGATTRVQLWVGYEGDADAAVPDAAVPDAWNWDAAPAPDATPPDAGP